MSGSTPPPDQPAAPEDAQPTDTVSIGGGYPPAGGYPPGMVDGPPPRRKRTGTVVAIVAALAVVAGGGAYAFVALDPLNVLHAGPQASEALPGDALAYVGVDLDPSAARKVDAVRFLEHFPGFDVSGVKDEKSDVRKAIVDDALDSSGCTDLTFDDDIAPWLGNKFGLALMPSSDSSNDIDDSNAVFALEVTDQGKASTALDKLGACADGGTGDTFGHAESGDYVLVAETQALADQYAAAADKGSLADNADFQDDMDSLGDLGVATMWVNIAGLVDAIPEDTTAIAPTGLPDLDLLKSTYQRAAATFRFSSDHAEVVSTVYGNHADVEHGDNEIVDLPDSTVFAMSEAGGGNRLAASWDDIKKAMSDQGVDIDKKLSRFEAQTGFTIPDDIETLLGDNLLLSVDSDGLTSDALNSSMSGSFDPSQLNVGLRFTGDGDKLKDLYNRVLDLATQQAGGEVPFSKVDFDDGFAMATNDDYGNTLAKLDGNLGDSDDFTSVIDDAASKEFVLYFDWDLVEDQIVQAARDEGAPDDVIANITPLRAFGITASTDGDYTMTTLQVSVND